MKAAPAMVALNLIRWENTHDHEKRLYDKNIDTVGDRPIGLGKNVYCRFRPSKTVSRTQRDIANGHHRRYP